VAARRDTAVYVAAAPLLAEVEPAANAEAEVAEVSPYPTMPEGGSRPPPSSMLKASDTLVAERSIIPNILLAPGGAAGAWMSREGRDAVASAALAPTVKAPTICSCWRKARAPELKGLGSGPLPAGSDPGAGRAPLAARLAKAADA
jgi:hypothetical protein